jgi:hypothetical protein
MKITPMRSIKNEIQSVLSNKLLLKYLNHYPNLKWFVLKFTLDYMVMWNEKSI